MATYRVISKAFANGMLYEPGGKRSTFTTDKPFPKNKIPSWLEGPIDAAPVPRQREESKQVTPAAPVSESQAVPGDGQPVDFGNPGPLAVAPKSANKAAKAEATVKTL